MQVAALDICEIVCVDRVERREKRPGTKPKEIDI